MLHFRILGTRPGENLFGSLVRSLTQQVAAKVDDVAQRNLLVAVEYLKDARGAAPVDYRGGRAAARQGGPTQGRWHLSRRQLLTPVAAVAPMVGGGSRSVGVSVRFTGAVGFRYAGLHLDGQTGRDPKATTHLVEPGG